MVTGVVPSPPRFLPSIFIAHRVQQPHCSSIFHRVLLTHALALSASQFVHKKKSQRVYTSMHSEGLELTKLTYTRLEDNLIRHRGDRVIERRRGVARGTVFQVIRPAAGFKTSDFVKEKSGGGGYYRRTTRFWEKILRGGVGENSMNSYYLKAIITSDGVERDDVQKGSPRLRRWCARAI